jgi:hypothetical protein
LRTRIAAANTGTVPAEASTSAPVVDMRADETAIGSVVVAVEIRTNLSTVDTGHYRFEVEAGPLVRRTLK